MDKKNITYDVKKDGIDEIIEETKNATMMLREVAWNGRDYHLELRKWIISGEELKPLRGIAFSTEEHYSINRTYSAKGAGIRKLNHVEEFV